MTQRKLLLINGLYSNGNIDGKDISAKERELESNFDRAVHALYHGQPKEENLEDNPFFAPAIRAQKERELQLQGNDKDAESLRELTNTEFEVDQSG